MVYIEKFADPNTKEWDQCARAYGVGSEEDELSYGWQKGPDCDTPQVPTLWKS